MNATSIPNWRTEFPDYPVADMPTLPDTFSDTSWHNDTCPSFTSDALGLIVWIDYSNPDDREFPDGPRFGLMEQQNGCELGCGLLETDDWDEVLTFIANWRKPE